MNSAAAERDSSRAMGPLSGRRGRRAYIARWGTPFREHRGGPCDAEVVGLPGRVPPRHRADPPPGPGTRRRDPRERERPAADSRVVPRLAGDPGATGLCSGPRRSAEGRSPGDGAPRHGFSEPVASVPRADLDGTAPSFRYSSRPTTARDRKPPSSKVARRASMPGWWARFRPRGSLRIPPGPARCRHGSWEFCLPPNPPQPPGQVQPTWLCRFAGVRGRDHKAPRPGRLVMSVALWSSKAGMRWPLPQEPRRRRAPGSNPSPPESLKRRRGGWGVDGSPSLS